MKILFVNPCLRLTSKSIYLPVGLGSVMTVVRDAGFKFDLLDIDLFRFSDAQVEEYIAKNSYDVVLFGCIVTHYKWAKWFCSLVKTHSPDCKIVVGNSVSGSIPELFLRKTDADIVVIGEGEFTTIEILQKLANKEDFSSVQGIAFREKNNGHVIITPKRPACDINTLPIIDWDLFDVQKYFEKSDAADAFGIDLGDGKVWRTMPVSTARGCIARCTFCHFVFWNDPYRHRSPEKIVEECRRNIEKYGANYINFWDDLSFSSVTSAEKVVDAIIDSGLKFFWSAAIRTDLFGNPKISYEKRLRVAEKFRKSGCINVSYSLESGSPQILEMMEKKVKMEYFEEQVAILKKVGITSNTSVVFGYPIETKDTIRETFEMCLKNGLYPSIGFLLPLPATKMYAYAKDHGFITDEDQFLVDITERQDICLNMTKMSDEEILSEIKTWGSVLNGSLNLGLDPEQLIRTGGYRKMIAEKQREQELDPANLKRVENDFTFNYSQQVFDINPGGKDPS